MKKTTKIQEGVIKFSNGKYVRFLCGALSEILTPEELQEIKITGIKFYPETDLTEEIKKQALDGKFPDGDGDEPDGEQGKLDLDDLGWDDVY